MNIAKTITEGLTYANHPFHIVLNYTVLLLVLIPNIFGAKRNTNAWIILFILFVIIQVSLWFLTGAVGISLVWCVLAGYNLLIFFIYRKESKTTAFLLLLSPLIALAAIVFYAILFPTVTTVAHSLSFLLGIALGLRLRRILIKKWMPKTKYQQQA